MTDLSKIKKGQKVKVIGFSSPPVMCNMLRLGIIEGDEVKCIAKMGPIIIGKDQLKLAIGKHLAENIYIQDIIEV